MTVAARDGHSWLRQPQLGTDHVDDALRPCGHVEQPDAFVAAVPLERREHVLRHDIEKWSALIASRDDVVDRRNRALGEPDVPPPRPQHVKGLRSRHLVDEVQSDEQLCLPVRQFSHGVCVPDFLQQGGGHERKWYYFSGARRLTAGRMPRWILLSALADCANAFHVRTRYELARRD